MSSSDSTKPDAFQSILAGGAAGGIESLVTYPTEYIKTRQQLSSSGSRGSSPISLLTDTIRRHGVRHLYAGASIFCWSNASKSAVRFAVFDMVKYSFAGKGSKSRTSSTLQTMFAGVCAGAAEGVTVLTPGENIKTKMIDAGSRGKSNNISAIRIGLTIVQEEGVRGLYRGVTPVTLKQSANAVVRFTSYAYLLDTLRGGDSMSDSSRFNFAAPAIAGGLAGVITVYATMSFDNIKTKMQSIQTRSHSGSIECLSEIVHEGGLKGLWKGTTPRLLRLSVSGMISFSIYEQVIATTSDLNSGRNVLNLRGIMQ